MLSIAAGAVGVALISSSAGFADDGGIGIVKTGMPLSAGKTLPPVIRTGPRGEKLIYTFVVTQHGAKILVSVNKKPLVNVEKKGDGYTLSDPNGSPLPFLTLPAPTH